MQRKSATGEQCEAGSGIRARAQTAWSGLVRGFGWRVRHPSPPPPPSRPIEHLPAGEHRRDCRRCAADFERAMRQVESANTAKSRFIATVSHELRTPLNAIIGFSQIIRDDIRRNGTGTALHADFAQEIYDSGVHLMDIINEILELANIESGRRPLAPETVALDSLFDLSIKKAAGAAARAGVSLEVVQPGITLTSDRLLLRHIIDQLLSNAVKFNVRGGWVRLSAEAQDDQVVISVADSGVGVAADDLGRVFQPFWQASTAVARDYDGAGLGLTLVKAATQAMGGDVVIDSRPGVGTRVRVALPLRPAAIDGTTGTVAQT